MALVHFLSATLGFAQCGNGYVGLEVLLASDDVAVIFSGKPEMVSDNGSAQIVAFRAGRVWKGPATQRMTIYRPLDPNRNARRPFVLGGTYVVVARRLSQLEKERLGVHTAESFGTDACGGGSRPIAASATEFLRVGPGHAPIDLKPGVRNPVVVPPDKINDVAPVYPPEAVSAGIRGVVIVEIHVDAAGTVGKIAVLRSIPALDQAASDCVRHWKFLPALIDDVPSQFVMTVAVSFAPQ